MICHFNIFPARICLNVCILTNQLRGKKGQIHLSVMVQVSPNQVLNSGGDFRASIYELYLTEGNTKILDGQSLYYLFNLYLVF